MRRQRRRERRRRVDDRRRRATIARSARGSVSAPSPANATRAHRSARPRGELFGRRADGRVAERRASRIGSWPSRASYRPANTSPRCASIHDDQRLDRRVRASRRGGECERIERRDADDRLVERKREALDRGEADAQAGERAGAGGDGEQVEIARRARRLRRARAHFAGQPLAVRARGVASHDARACGRRR